MFVQGTLTPRRYSSDNPLLCPVPPGHELDYPPAVYPSTHFLLTASGILIRVAAVIG